MTWKILIVDDDKAMLKSCQKVLRERGHNVDVSADPLEACRRFSEKDYDLVVVDLKMPGMSGIQLMREFKQMDCNVPVIMITAFATLESALRAVREGAYDYIPKPFSAEHLNYTVERCMEYQRALGEVVEIPRGPDSFDPLADQAGLTQAIQVARRVSMLDINVLLQGESGTGKELFARGIHECSPRSCGPLVAVDCASITESLMESELFGYEPGAFTGATKSKPGLLESANGGTVFFDEVGNMAPGIQSKLLRAVEERKVRRLGGLKLIDLDIRIISATNRDLQSMILDGDFMGDLFFRLNVVPIHLPPLRDRKEDIPLLADHFLQDFADRTGTAIRAVSSATLIVLESHDWPGNVRELRNVVEHAASLAIGNQITPLDLPPSLIRRPGSPPGFPVEAKEFKEAKQDAVASFEKEYVSRLLELTGGNVSRAARIAKIARTGFHRLMKKYGLRSTRFK